MDRVETEANGEIVLEELLTPISPERLVREASGYEPTIKLLAALGVLTNLGFELRADEANINLLVVNPRGGKSEVLNLVPLQDDTPYISSDLFVDGYEVPNPFGFCLVGTPTCHVGTADRLNPSSLMRIQFVGDEIKSTVWFKDSQVLRLAFSEMPGEPIGRDIALDYTNGRLERIMLLQTLKSKDLILETLAKLWRSLTGYQRDLEKDLPSVYKKGMQQLLREHLAMSAAITGKEITGEEIEYLIRCAQKGTPKEDIIAAISEEKTEEYLPQLREDIEPTKLQDGLFAEARVFPQDVSSLLVHSVFTRAKGRGGMLLPRWTEQTVTGFLKENEKAIREIGGLAEYDLAFQLNHISALLTNGIEFTNVLPEA